MDSLLKACHDIEKVSGEKIQEAVAVACQYLQLDIIKYMAPQLNNQSLIRCIEDEYHSTAGMNQQLDCAIHRRKLSRLHISFSGTCRKSSHSKLSRKTRQRY